MEGNANCNGTRGQEQRKQVFVDLMAGMAESGIEELRGPAASITALSWSHGGHEPNRDASASQKPEDRDYPSQGMPRLVSFATGLPWHVASRHRDRQLIRAAKKGHLSNHSRTRDASRDGAAFLSAADEEGEESAGFLRYFNFFGESEISVEEALAKGADVNAADFSGNTALHYACEEGYDDLVKFLLACDDVSTDVTATMDWTPLHCAASKGRVETIQALAKKGCQVHLAARDGNTALHMAAMGGHCEVVKLLVELGCDTRLRNEEGRTAADVALFFRNGEYNKICQHLEKFHTTHAVKKDNDDSFALKIRLVEGNSIKSMDVMKDSDPYCALCISNPPGFVRSFTCRSTDRPKWDQILFLRMHLAPQILRIEVWDDDFGDTEDDFIGQGSVNLCDLVSKTKAFLSNAEGQYDADHPDYPTFSTKTAVKSKKLVTGTIALDLQILKIPPDLVRKAGRTTSEFE